MNDPPFHDMTDHATHRHTQTHTRTHNTPDGALVPRPDIAVKHLGRRSLQPPLLLRDTSKYIRGGSGLKP